MATCINNLSLYSCWVIFQDVNVSQPGYLLTCCSLHIFGNVAWNWYKHSCMCFCVYKNNFAFLYKIPRSWTAGLYDSMLNLLRNWQDAFINLLLLLTQTEGDCILTLAFFFFKSNGTPYWSFWIYQYILICLIHLMML
jgi:hypothetical protein